MSKFKVGDAVRVKAGSPVHVPCTGQELGTCASKVFFGKKLRVIDVTATGKIDYELPGTNDWDRSITNILESWNDAEEWDGSEWVAKKTEAKECFVVKRGDCFPMGEIVSSTNKALARAKSYAEAHPGTEYVVYQEKCSVKREKKSKAQELAEKIQAMGVFEWLNDGDGGKASVVDVSHNGDVVSLKFKIS